MRGSGVAMYAALRRELSAPENEWYSCTVGSTRTSCGPRSDARAICAV